MSILANIHKVEQLAASIFADVVGKGSDLTVRRAILLQAIDATPGVSQTTLCADTGVDRSTLATMVGSMQRLGLVKRVRNKKDARAYNVTLTAAGKKLCVAGAAALEQTAVQLLRDLPKLKALA